MNPELVTELMRTIPMTVVTEFLAVAKEMGIRGDEALKHAMTAWIQEQQSLMDLHPTVD